MGLLFKMVSGDIQQALGYRDFFLWVLLAALTSNLAWYYHRRGRSPQQHQPTGGFGAEVLGEVETAVFGVGLLAGGFGHASAPGSGQVAMSCRPDFPARPASTLTPVLVIASRVRGAGMGGGPSSFPSS